MNRIAAFIACSTVFALLNLSSAPLNAAGAAMKPPIRIAVLGDSDSHSYQDTYSFPPGSPARGGKYRASTLQWTEVLMSLRPTQLDMGPWGEWGQRRRFAQVREWLGMSARHPKKEDFLYNMAYSGAVCDDLTNGISRQAPRLVDLIQDQSDSWRDGIVVIRMGINDIGTYPMLKLIAAEPSAPVMLQKSENCALRIAESIKLLRSVQPHLRFVIVSPFNDTDDPNNVTSWNSAREQANLTKGFSHLKEKLRAMAADPSIHYIDDNEWFHARWGGRDADGKPNYKTVRIGNVLEVTNSVGDEPTHTLLNDDHAGLVWNTLWAQALVDEMNRAWQIGIPTITDSETAQFVGRRVGNFSSNASGRRLQ